MKKVYLVYPKKLGTIAPEVYGHFSEHIGGVFYDGLWVGKDSKVPNIRGFRKDLVEKLKAIHPRFCAGPADAMPKPMTGGTASAKTGPSVPTGGPGMITATKPTR